MMHFLFVTADFSILSSGFQCGVNVILLVFALMLLQFQISALLDGSHPVVSCIAALSSLFFLDPVNAGCSSHLEVVDIYIELVLKYSGCRQRTFYNIGCLGS